LRETQLLNILNLKSSSSPLKTRKFQAYEVPFEYIVNMMTAVLFVYEHSKRLGFFHTSAERSQGPLYLCVFYITIITLVYTMELNRSMMVVVVP
jgi:hypothetical protein